MSFALFAARDQQYRSARKRHAPGKFVATVIIFAAPRTSRGSCRYLLFDVLCLQADPAFPAMANITLNLDFNGLVIRRAVTDPALPFPPNDHLAPTTLVCSSSAVTEWDKFDSRLRDARGLNGQRLYEF